MTATERLKAAVRRFRPKPKPAAEPMIGTDEWAVGIETRLSKLESRATAMQLITLLALAVVGALERLPPGALNKVLDAIK